METTYVLIPGRTSEQGCGISEGKSNSKYQTEITTLRIAPEDLAALGVAAGDQVRLRSEFGEASVQVSEAKKDELPPGVFFIAYGDASSRLMGGDTHGSGMPTSKGIDVSVEVIGRR